jgi:hypothetical protein
LLQDLATASTFLGLFLGMFGMIGTQYILERTARLSGDYALLLLLLLLLQDVATASSTFLGMVGMIGTHYSDSHVTICMTTS